MANPIMQHRPLCLTSGSSLQPASQQQQLLGHFSAKSGPAPPCASRNCDNRTDGAIPVHEVTFVSRTSSCAIRLPLRLRRFLRPIARRSTVAGTTCAHANDSSRSKIRAELL